MKYLVAILLLLGALPCSAQKQGNIWYFGNRAGVDFNSGTPVPIHDGKTYLVDGNSDGSASIADENGALLFYTNGVEVWNRNHEVMPNGEGLLGSYTSTQSALIVPRPGSNGIYYLFTTDAFHPDGLKDGLRYSVIDLCRDGGLGDVVPEKKNVLLLATATEKLCGAMHANGVDVWVMTHEHGTDAFYAYLLTERGVTDTVTSRVGSVHKIVSPAHPGYQKDAAGQMKISPDGRYLALGNANSVAAVGLAVCEAFHFDNATGLVSDPVSLASPEAQAFGDPYGLTFSPNSRLLYVCRKQTVVQYDLSSWNAPTIRASMVQVAPPFNPPRTQGVGMQLGPDGKVYLPSGRYLDVIHNPNVVGSGCVYDSRSIDLDTNEVSVSSYCLPGFIDSYSYTSRGVCQKDLIHLTDMVGRTGSEIELPVKITFGSEYTQRQPRAFTATLRFDRSLLYPSAEKTTSVIDGNDRILTYSDVWDGRSDVLGKIRALVGITNADHVPVALTGFTWDSDDPNVLASGSFDLTGFCDEGGNRLIEVGSAAGLKLANPARGLTRIDYSTPESGRTRIYLVDAAGRIAAPLVDGEVRSGEHTVMLDAGGIASGSYMLVMETPTERVVSPVQIVN